MKEKTAKQWAAIIRAEEALVDRKRQMLSDSDLLNFCAVYQTGVAEVPARRGRVQVHVTCQNQIGKKTDEWYGVGEATIVELAMRRAIAHAILQRPKLKWRKT